MPSVRVNVCRRAVSGWDMLGSLLTVLLYLFPWHFSRRYSTQLQRLQSLRDLWLGQVSLQRLHRHERCGVQSLRSWYFSE
jgi:hypothetical protein